MRRIFGRAICAVLLGGTMLVAAAPAASASDSWDRASQDFGNQDVGSTSDPQTFALIAQCDAFFPNSLCASPPNGVHSYGAITTTGPFAIVPATDVCNARGGVLFTQTTSQPVDVCTLQVTFKTTAGGVKTGTLSTTTSPAGVPLKVSLKGTGILTGNGQNSPNGSNGQTGQTGGKKCKKKGKKSSASAAKKKKCKKK